MADVFTALVGAIANCIGPENCQKCEYRDIRTKTRCKTMLLRDALELLKEQEPVKPINIKKYQKMYSKVRCGNCPICGYEVEEDEDNNFCSKCGRRLDWDG